MRHYFIFSIPIVIGSLFFSCTKESDYVIIEPEEEILEEQDVTGDAIMTVNIDNNSGEGAAEGSLKLIDNDTTSKFLVQDIQNGLIVQFQYDEPVQVAAYDITSGNDFDGRDPLNWEFSASNDGENWVVLDRQHYEMFSKRRLTSRYTFINKEKFSYYKWHVTKLYGGGQMFQASELRLFTIPHDEQKAPAFTEIDTIVQNDLTLYFVNKSTAFPGALKQNMIDVFFTNYPRLMADFNPNAQKTVAFRIEPRYNGVAYVFGGFATYAESYMLNNPNDLDVVTHEIMHLIQSYAGGAPGWITEGIADYVRYKYGLHNDLAGWSLPNYNSSQKYTDAYRVTARFFVWIEQNYNSDLVKILDGKLRVGSYTNDFWAQETGKTVDELWELYGQNPQID